METLLRGKQHAQETPLWIGRPFVREVEAAKAEPHKAETRNSQMRAPNTQIAS